MWHKRNSDVQLLAAACSKVSPAFPPACVPPPTMKYCNLTSNHEVLQLVALSPHVRHCLAHESDRQAPGVVPAVPQQPATQQWLHPRRKSACPVRCVQAWLCPTAAHLFPAGTADSISVDTACGHQQLGCARICYNQYCKHASAPASHQPAGVAA